ncbi:hypothetical protein P9112_013957 [Eukaryota sp. TZLM1-RC]
MKRSFRLTLLHRWIDSLLLGPPIDSIPNAITNGLLLVKMLERLGYTFTGIYDRPLTRAPCISNIEKALEVLHKRILPSKIPSADEIYNGSGRCNSLVSEVFDVFILKEVKHRFHHASSFFLTLASMYNLSINQEELLLFPFNVFIACFDYCTDEEVDKSYIRQCSEPAFNMECASYALRLMVKHQIPVYFTPKEWINCYEDGFAMVQIFVFFAKFSENKLPDQKEPFSQKLSPSPVNDTSPSQNMTSPSQNSPEPSQELDSDVADILSNQFSVDVSIAKGKRKLSDSVVSVNGFPDSDDENVDVTQLVLDIVPSDPGRLNTQELNRLCERITLLSITKVKRVSDLIIGIVFKRDQGYVSTTLSFVNSNECSVFFTCLNSLLSLIGVL